MNRLTSRIKPFRLCIGVLCVVAAASVARAQTGDESTAPSLSEASLRSPAVASVLDRPRETADQQLHAIFTLLDLGENDVARSLWDRFTGAELDEAAKAALVRQFGTARFLTLARRETTGGLDGSREFAKSCLDAAATQGRDPRKLAMQIEDLRSNSPAVRRAASSDLSVTGDAGAVACLEALSKADEGDADKQLRTELMLTLAKMRPGVEPMLIAALADGHGQFRRDVIELTGYLHLQDAVPWLAAIAAGADAEPTIVSAAYGALTKMGLSSPDSSEARAVVLSEIRRLESFEHPPSANYPWWTFDPKGKKLANREVASDENQLLTIARLSRLLAELPNAQQTDQRLALIYAYQVSQLLEQPVPSEFQQQAENLSVAELTETLHDALHGNQINAATACAILLGDRKAADALSSFAGRRSPLAAALVHPNRELRFAALEAVMKIKPQQSFAGASEVAKALWYFAAGAGTPEAIVASPVVTRASDWAGQLRALGYDATPITTGRELVLTAPEARRLELVLVDSDIGRPLLREVIYALRSNPQLARLPIGILSSLHNLTRAERIAEQDSWLIATPRPHSDDSMKTVLAELAELGNSPATSEQRTKQSSAALGWIADLLTAGHPYDELLRDSHLVNQTLYNPELTSASLRVLTVLGTADSQQMLVDVVSTPTQPIETRRLASKAFAQSVEQFGKLLTSAEILHQYDRYNASETADEETQQVLSGVLDILESKKP